MATSDAVVVGSLVEKNNLGRALQYTTRKFSVLVELYYLFLRYVGF